MSRRSDRSPSLAVGVCFATSGLSLTAALSRMPSIREQIGATSAQLSLALVCFGIGSVLAMPLTGRLTERLSSATVVRGAGALALVAWTVAGWAPSVITLGLCLLLVGAGVGLWDVAMNIQGHAVEQEQRRVLMPALHAVFSFGSVAGALVGAGFARAEISIKVQFPLVGALMLTVLLLCAHFFIPDRVEQAVDQAGVKPAERRGITRVEVLLGVMVLATAVGEGAANDWLALALVDTRGAPEAFGAVALAGFNLTMGVGRLIGGQLIARLGRVAVLRVSGSLACFGVLLLCLVDSPTTALIGAAFWGLGLAVVFPSGMSAAGEIPGRGARAIAVVSTIGYSGFLLGAPLIGQLTHIWPLDRALLVVAGFVLLVVVLAPVAKERRTRTELSIARSGDPGAGG